MNGMADLTVLDSQEYSARWKSKWFAIRHSLRGRLHRKFRRDVAFLRKFIPPGSLVVDAGSNHGRFAIEVADLYSGESKCVVHAFEPIDYNFQVQRRVLAGRDNLTAHHCGLSDQAADFEMYIPLRPNGELFHGGAFIANEADFPLIAEERNDMAYVRQRVCCRTLDSVFADSGAPVAFVKIDVEGHEFEVLRGASRILASDRPTLLIESRGENAPLQFLTELGFRFYDLDMREDGRWTESPREIQLGIGRAGKHHDVLCWHPEGLTSYGSGQGQAPDFSTSFSRTRFGT